MPLSDLFPTNAKIFASSLMGDTSPITEKNFTADELAAMVDLIKNKAAQDQQNEAVLRRGVRGPEEYAAFPNSRNGQDVPYSDYMAEKNKKLATYDKTKGKTSITYTDYPDEAKPDTHGWLNTFLKSYTDPRYGVATSLGQFNALDRGNQYEVQDQYNWNKSEPFQMADLFELFKRPEAIGNALMRLGPQVNRPVKIMLPKQ